MNTHEKETFQQTYDWVKTWQELPWSHDEPSLFLAEICNERKPGTALDIGCGAGTDSVFLAQQGWDVTSLDFMPKALEYTQARAAEAGVSVTPIEADVTTWEPPQKYDIVLDHGLLHNMDTVRYAEYRERIMSALAEDGEFVLLHWHPLFPGQPQGKIGPVRTNREDIKSFFAPELQEKFFAREEFEDLPDMVGRGMTQAFYWFRRNQADLRSTDLIDQVKATLTRHGVDFESMIAGAGDAPLDAEIADDLLACMVGPGRLGISHRIPSGGEVGAMIAAFAEKAGQSPRYVDNLLRVFASEAHGNVCITNAKCTECDVKICKRLRYR
jgi:SAM-dependent methyltransferase